LKKNLSPVAGITLQVSDRFEFVADRFREQPRLTTALWGTRRTITKKDRGTVTVQQLMDFLETEGAFENDKTDHYLRDIDTKKVCVVYLPACLP
jgi:hypothetical protein